MWLFLFAFIISLIPNVAWLYFFYKKDKYEPEPLPLVGLAFFLGIVSTLFAYIGNSLLGEKFLLNRIPPFIYGRGVFYFLYFFFIVGPCEEIVKFMMVKLFLFDNKEFDEIMDGIIYSVSVALGFAFSENIFYFYNSYTSVQEASLTAGMGIAAGVITILIRSFIANVGHAVFGGMMGFYIGLAKFSNRKTRYLVEGLVISSFLHGTYDFLVSYFNRQPGAVFAIAISVLIASISVLNSKIELSLRFSPHRLKKKNIAPGGEDIAQNNLEVDSEHKVCPRCGYKNPQENKFCKICRYYLGRL